MDRFAFRPEAEYVPGIPTMPPRTIRRSRSWLVAPIALSVLVGCAAPGFEPDRSPDGPPQREDVALSAVSPNVEAPEVRTYRIQAGDLLEVQFFFNPELNQPIRVQPDGAITLPFLGTRVVRGMSIPEVSEMVRDVFAAELRQPQVVVQLIEAVPRQVYVGGAVNRPQEIPYRSALTPLEAVLAAGGFSSTGKAGQIVLIRKDARGRSVPAVLDPQDTAVASMALEPWDIVFVLQGGKASEWVDRYLRAL